MNNNPASWIKSNGIIITLFAGMVTQSFTAVWWMSSLSSKVNDHDRRIDIVEKSYVPRPQIEQGQQDVKDAIANLQASINILISQQHNAK